VKIISEAVANWQLERLEALIRAARARAKFHKLRNSSLAGEHLNLADEYLDEAIAAMKYHKYEQASFACQSGFMQLGLAEFLLKYAARVDQGIKAVQAVTERGVRASEEEELANYLASSLAEMKVAIEYSNCRVSSRAQSVLDRAMDYYNDCLKEIKQSEGMQAKVCAQAGLLCLLLASELIGAENQMALPGWRGLSNPMLVSHLRRAPEFLSNLAEVRQRLHLREQADAISLNSEEQDKSLLLRKHWEKAYNDFLLAVNSLAGGKTSHAQSLLKAAQRELESCYEIIGMDDPDDISAELEESENGRRIPVVDAVSTLSEVKDIIDELKIQRREYLLSCVDKVARFYKEALRAYGEGRYQRAEKALASALLELDLLRQQLQFRKQRHTGAHPAGDMFK